jgi:transglutaminase-like putative cysteine protease
MLIRCGYALTFDCPTPTPMLAQLSLHPSRNKDLRTSQRILCSPDIPLYNYVDTFGNTCTRLVTPPGTLTLSADFVVYDPGTTDAYAPDAQQIAVEALPDEALIYLLSSRYCEIDRLSDTAWSLFGNSKPGWARVQAIVDFVHDHISFGYEHARPTKTAWDAFQERRGVCRDFAHLAIAFCRCMNIPARYATGYLGDIGVPPMDAPMDFSAWFEVYLGGEWYTFDARHNRPRIGRVLMARGRDATDTALTTSFGPAWLSGFEVTSEEVDSIDAINRAEPPTI